MRDVAGRPDLRERNRRLGAFLVAWILALAFASALVAWLR